VRRILFICLLLGLPWTAEAATYWVSTSGSDNNNCLDTTTPQTTGAKRTINAGIACAAAAGDTLYIRGGTYSEPLDDQTAWGSGTSARPITIAAYTGESVTMRLQPRSAGVGITSFQGVNNHAIDYITIDGIAFDQSDMGNNCFTLNGTQNITIKNGRMYNCHGGCGLSFSASNGQSREAFNVLVSHMELDHNGDAFPCSSNICYGAYWSTHDSILENSDIHDNGGFGVQIYREGGGADNNILRNNKFHHNGTCCRNFGNETGGVCGNTCSCTGTIVGAGRGDQIYNNLFYDDFQGLVLSTGGVNATLAYQNTIYGNQNVGLWLNSPNSTVKNNIAYNNGTNIEANNLSGVTRDYNLCNSTDTNLGCTISGDPRFVQPQTGDFHLGIGSAAINCCPRIPSVPTDAEGTNRTDPTAAGALEFVAPGPPP
jgi:hypothetical protein